MKSCNSMEEQGRRQPNTAGGERTKYLSSFITLETRAFDKFISVSGSNNAGVWGRRPQPPEANGGSGAEPRALQRFYSPFSKKYAFLGIFCPKFLLKTRVLNV